MDWKNKPARKQVSEDELNEFQKLQNGDNNGTNYNIWYNKSNNLNSDSGNSKSQRFVNKFRLDVKNDSGTTRADDTCTKFCLFFARGCCSLGSNCSFWHHVPQLEESTRQVNVDCFGREKFNNYRDDMGGIGTIHNQNDTLYIGGISQALNNKILKPIQIESRLKFMFNELGPISKLKYIESKNCAFVTFRGSINAEFAKEVMSNQTLLLPHDPEWSRRLEGSGLLVKWANEDPDATAKKAKTKENESKNLQFMELLLAGAKNPQRKRNSGRENSSKLPRLALDSTGVDLQSRKGRISKIDALKMKSMESRSKIAGSNCAGGKTEVKRTAGKRTGPLVAYPDSSEESETEA